MIRITIELDEDFDDLNMSEDDIINAVEDVFSRGDVNPIESVAAEVIDLDWD